MLCGLIGLWLGTELVIRGAVHIADYYEISQLFLGLSVLAIGTDLPELVIAVNASLHSALGDVNTSELIIGNAIGSCMSQISLVLGIAGLFGYLTLTKRHLFEDGAMLVGSILLLALLGYDGVLTWIDGLILIIVYLLYYSTLFYQENLGKKMKKKFSEQILTHVFYLLAGLFIVAYTSGAGC